MTLVRETAEWGGVIFVLALIGTAAYVRRDRTEPDEIIAPGGSRFRRLCLGVVLTGTALLAPAYQAHLHTDVSFQKHIGFGLFFAAPIAGLGLARVLGDHFRRPHIAVGVWCVALVLGLVQANQLYQSWPNSTQFVRAMSRYLTPHGRYLVEEPSVPIYYLLGPSGCPAQPVQLDVLHFLPRQEGREPDRHKGLHRRHQGWVLPPRLLLRGTQRRPWTPPWAAPWQTARRTTWPPRSTS